MSAGIIEFLLDDKHYIDARINFDKSLVQIREQKNIPDNYIFTYHDSNNSNIIQFEKREEFEKKIDNIIIDNKVYLKYQHPLILIKQGDSIVKKLQLDTSITLSQLKRYLPPRLNNEKFKCFDDLIDINEENNTRISDIISNDNIIYLTGTYNINPNDRGRFKYDRSRSVAENLDFIMQSKKNIIFFGSVGAGKTTLVNIITGANFETSDSGFSKTLDLQFATSLIRRDCIAIDFPGLLSGKDQLNHFNLQKETLSILPVRMICFVVKYDNRYDRLLNEINIMKQIFEEYQNNIIIIFTHTEEIRYRFNIQSEILNIVKEKFKYQNNKIIFSHINIDYDTLMSKIRPLMEVMTNIDHINFKTQNLIQSMQLYGDEFKAQHTEFQNEFNNTLNIFKNKFDEYRNNNDIKRALFFALKLYKTRHVKKFSKLIRQSFNDDNLEFLDKIIFEIIMYTNSIRNQFLDFCKNIEIGIQSSNFATKELINEYNKFKECHIVILFGLEYPDVIM